MLSGNQVASLAFNVNVDIQEIKIQGTWSSEAVWTYIVCDSNKQASVASTFSTMLRNSLFVCLIKRPPLLLTK